MPRPFLVGVAILLVGGCHFAPRPFGRRTEIQRRSTASKRQADDRRAEETPSEADRGVQHAADTGRYRPPEVGSPVALVDYGQPQPDDVAPMPAGVLEQPDTDAPATADSQSLGDFVALAEANNPALAVAAARVRSVRGQWVQTGLPPNPRIGYVAEDIEERLERKQGAFVSQQFVTGKKLQLNRQVAAWQVHRAEQDLATVQMRVLTDVRIAFYDALIAQERHKTAGNLVRISQRAVDSTKALFQAGEVSEADPMRAEVAQQRARIVLDNAASQLDEAWRRLAAVVGMPELSRSILSGDVSPEQLVVSWEESLARTLAESPEIAAARASVEAADWTVRRAKAEVIPDVTVRATLQNYNLTNGPVSALEVGLPLPLINRNQGGIRRARAEATRVRRIMDQLGLDLQARLAAAFRRHDFARNQVDRYRRSGGIIDTSLKSYELVRTGYSAGEFSLLDLLTAQRTYFQAQLDYLTALQQLWSSVMEIRGMTLRGSLTVNGDRS